MLIFLTLISYLGSITSKYFFYRVAYSQKIKSETPLSYNLAMLLVPLSAARGIWRRSVRNDIYRLKFALSELLGISAFFVFAYEFLNNFSFTSDYEVLFAFVFYLLTTLFLLYLAIFDLLTFTVPESISKLLFLYVIIINFFVGLVRYLYFRLEGEMILDINLGNLDNMLMGIAFWLLVWAAVKFSNNKAFGSGDIDILAVVGFSLGWPEALSSIFFTITLGGLLSLIYALIIKRFKNVQVPFVPMILLGYVFALSFSDEFISILLGQSSIYL